MGAVNLYFAQKPTMNTYKYDAGIGTPEHYDIDTYQQVFYSADQKMIPIYGMGVHLGGMWGSGNSFVVGDQEKEVPALLKIGYYSYVENKFFEGEFKLPQSEIEKYLQEKVVNPVNGREQPKYNYFSIGIALNGGVVLWIKGNESQKEIAKFQASEKHYEKFSDVFDDERSQKEIYEGWFKNYSEELKKRILINDLPYKHWDAYRKKYRVRTVVSKDISRIQIDKINMEKETLYTPNDGYSESSIPYNIWIKWADAGKKYEARIVFSKDEKYYRAIYKGENGSKFPEDFTHENIYKVFQTLDENAPAELLIKINAENSDIRLGVKQHEKEYPISGFIVKIFGQ